jgi:starch synthase
VKKFYNEDPHFADTKVVFSAYENDFVGAYDTELVNKLKFDGFSAEDVAEVSDPTVENLHKLAFRYSDGLVEGSENLAPGISAAIKASEKATLAYCNPALCVKEYSDFYDTILEENTVLIN